MPPNRATVLRGDVGLTRSHGETPASTWRTVGPCAETSPCCADSILRPRPTRSRRRRCSTSARSARSPQDRSWTRRPSQRRCGRLPRPPRSSSRPFHLGARHRSSCHPADDEAVDRRTTDWPIQTMSGVAHGPSEVRWCIARGIATGPSGRASGRTSRRPAPGGPAPAGPHPSARRRPARSEPVSRRPGTF